MNNDNNHSSLYWSVVETGERGFQVDSSLYIGQKRNSLAIDQAQWIQPIRAWQAVEDKTHERTKCRRPQTFTFHLFLKQSFLKQVFCDHYFNFS